MRFDAEELEGGAMPKKRRGGRVVDSGALRISRISFWFGVVVSYS